MIIKEIIGINIILLITNLIIKSFKNKKTNWILDAERYLISKYKNININIESCFWILGLVTGVIYLILRNIIKIESTALLISLIIFIMPIVIIKIRIDYRKNKILNMLPAYIINLRNNIEIDNNIIKAIKKTEVEEPLIKCIEEFNIYIEKGINVYNSFERLKRLVNVKKFNDLVNIFQTCYLNGGNYTKVLNKYLYIITNENNKREELKEKSRSIITTLIVLLFLNIYLLLFFVFMNETYKQIILKTSTGNIILNFSIIVYLIIGLLIYKIYQMEG
ncbi:MAG: hypothetical protein PHR25_00675 [Clostridia bacterium]|nr:hypothetical protein [Clostridia bacterium]MDD4375282.1 hypothetical protein [Clostridia bacterium]